jgi:Putative prokaryotic signal transducing protein
MSQEHSHEAVVVAYTAESNTEAMVIRSLLQSAGIESPGSVSTDPFPIPENPEGPHNLEILVLESQADEARKIITEYQSGSSSVSDAKSSDESSDL